MLAEARVPVSHVHFEICPLPAPTIKPRLCVYSSSKQKYPLYFMCISFIERKSTHSNDRGTFLVCNVHHFVSLIMEVTHYTQTKSSRESEKLDNYEWFWGDMNRADCVAKMSREGKIGRFVIRIDPRGSLAMTFWCGMLL